MNGGFGGRMGSGTVPEELKRMVKKLREDIEVLTKRKDKLQNEITAAIEKERAKLTAKASVMAAGLDEERGALREYEEKTRKYLDDYLHRNDKTERDLDSRRQLLEANERLFKKRADDLNIAWDGFAREQKSAADSYAKASLLIASKEKENKDRDADLNYKAALLVNEAQEIETKRSQTKLELEALERSVEDVEAKKKENGDLVGLAEKAKASMTGKLKEINDKIARFDDLVADRRELNSLRESLKKASEEVIKRRKELADFEKKMNRREEDISEKEQGLRERERYIDREVKKKIQTLQALRNG